MAVSWVEKLLALQDLDMEIRKLKLRLTMIPKEAEKLQQQIAVIENKVKLARGVKAEHELQIKKNENEIAELNGKIEKLQAQSELVKKNTEYQAMLGSIAMLKKSIGDLETSQLELMETIEQDNEAIRKALAAVKPESAPLREELSELAELVNDVKRRGRELLAKRPELRSMVDEFEKIMDSIQDRRLRIIVRNYYALGWTDERIGDQLGLSRQHVNRLRTAYVVTGSEYVKIETF